MNKINKDICNIIASFVICPRYDLLEWIDYKEFIIENELSANINSIDYLKNNLNFYNL